MLKYFTTLLSVCFVAQIAYAQLGGQNIYTFLNLSNSARISGLGGNLITVRDDDVNLAYANPSLLNASMNQQLAFSHNFHLADISNGYAAYGQHLNNINTTFHFGIQYINYGEFVAADIFGQEEGTFKASEYAITLGAAKEFYERLSVGANVKLVTSQFEAYNSLGLVADLALTYFDTSSNFTATIVAKNMGTQLTQYEEGNDEPLPFEIQVGISKKLRYLPFRFSIIYHHFDRWNITYDDPNTTENTLFLGEGEVEENPTSIWFENFFRHFIFNGEFLFGKAENFRLRVGYNHFMRQELAVQNFRSLGGFSFGAGIKINRFRIDFGRSIFHLAGGVTHLGISTNLKEFKR